MISRTQFELCVRYDAPVSDCRRVLRVLPLRREGQRVLSEKWQTLPPPDKATEKPDATGNRRLLLRHRRIEAEFRFGMELEVETTGAPLAEAAPDFALWKMPSRAVVFVPELQKLAREARGLAPLERAAHFSALCQQNLEYNAKAEAAPPRCDAVWASKLGNCADFSHLLLSLCRCSGLPARYVAGFNPTEGQMHAWVEVWSEGFWHGFDATLGRGLSAGSVAVAVGRDFFDCAPHHGTFRGAAGAEISLFCRTQITRS